MSIFRVTCRLITNQTNLIKISSISAFKHPIELFSTPRWITTKCNDSSFHEKYLMQNVQYANQQQILRKYSKKLKNMESPKIYTQELTKNLTFISTERLKLNLDKKTMKLNEPIDSPLVIIFSWLLAKKKHLLKYSKIYTDQGFNVVIVEVTPWQVLWPAKGSQLVAAEALNFIEINVEFSPLIIHGFSVGGYIWGEIMAKMANDLPRYQPLLDRINAQIWDSTTDLTEIQVGLPLAIFPNNKTLQNGLRNYVVYHMKAFHDVATVHYLRANQLFYWTLLKAPALFLVSNNDPISSVNSNRIVKENMESDGIKTNWYCWEKSAHVMHYQNYPEQYLSCLFKHLEDTNVFERIASKTRAKL